MILAWFSLVWFGLTFPNRGLGCVHCGICEWFWLDLVWFGLVWLFQTEVWVVCSVQRVPDTRPEPEIFKDTRSIPDLFSKSSGISGIGYFEKMKFLKRSLLFLVLAKILSYHIFLTRHVSSTNHLKFYLQLFSCSYSWTVGAQRCTWQWPGFPPFQTYEI